LREIKILFQSSFRKFLVEKNPLKNQFQMLNIHPNPSIKRLLN